MSDEIHPLPITGELDLHTFRPREVGSLVPEYLAECRVRGILTVRIVHGKGTGALRETVHALLAREPAVLAYTLAGEQMGGWGATVVRLRPRPGDGAAGPTETEPAAG
jgi:DNA-nicking Smr family endonuclease